MKERQEGKKGDPVLVIDDDEAQLKTIADILETETLQSICCRTGKEALEVCKQQEVNVAILDLRLPDMNGLEVLRQLKQQNPSIKVIINTGYASFESAMAAVNEEAFAYVQKMGDVEELLAHVHRAFHAHLTLYSEKLEQVVEKRTAELLAANIELKKDIAERKRAEEALRESEERFRSLIGSTSDGIIISDQSGNITLWNRGAQNIFGHQAHEIIGKPVAALMPETYRRRHSEARQRLGKTGRRKHIGKTLELEGLRKDGSVFPLEISLSTWQTREMSFYSAIIRDITERVRANEELKTLSTAIQQSSAVVLITDPKGNIEYVNPKFCELTGYSAEEVLGKNPRILQGGGTSMEEYKQLWETILAGKEWRGEFHNKKKNGKLYWEDAVISAILNGNGDITHFLAVKEDITERKRVEVALRQYAHIVSSSTDMLALLDKKYIYKAANTAYLQAFNLNSEQLIGHTASEVFGEAYFNSVIKPYADRCLAGEEVNFQTWVDFPAHGEKFMDVTYYPHTEVENKIQGFVVNGRDITERKRAEEALKNSEDKLKEAQKVGKLGHYVFNITTDCWTSSDELDDIFGIDETYQRDVEGWLQIVHPDFAETMANYLRDHVLKQRRKFDKEYKIINIKTKQEKWVHGLGNLKFDANNNPVEMFGTIQDITERKQAEEALKKSELWNKEIFEGSRDAIFIVDSNTHLVDVNHAATSLTGYSKNELLKMSIPDLHEEEDLEAFNKFFKGIIGGESITSEAKIFRKDGTKVDTEFSNKRIIIGSVSYMHTIARDVTERKRAEVELRESEGRFKCLFYGLGDAVFVTKIGGTDWGQIIEVNPAAEEQTGYTKDELIGMNISKDLAIHESGEIDQAEWDKRLTEGQFVTATEMKKRKDGTQYWVEVVVTPIDYKGAMACLSINRDITRRKRAEAEKAKLGEQLRRFQKLETIGTLAGGIAHDFNNILTPIMGYADMALSDLPSSNPLCEDLEHILKAANRGKDLVEQILLFSKQVEKERKPLALHLIVIEALKLLRPTIPTTIEIRQRIDASGDKVLADATQMHQVIVNLCTNAYQAMEEKGGTLTIELKQVEVGAATAKLHPNLNEAKYVRLTVMDTGTGMDKATMERIFEPFFTLKAVDKGTGMGLSVVHGIVYSHDGDILVDSEPGKGSTFHVYLPIVKAEGAAAKKESEAITGGQESIFVVDDDKAVAKVIKMMLERLGYKVDVYNSSIEALKNFRRQPGKYDMVISDLTMPNMTGLDLSEKLQKIRPEFPTIIMTGYGDSLTDNTLKQYGIKKIIGKPIALRELAGCIRKVLDK